MLPETIRITSSPGSELSDFLSNKNYSSIMILCDENTYSHCYPLVEVSLPTHTHVLIKSGEENKNIESCSIIWQAMTDANMDRHSVLIIIGGGVLGDMGGFCATTYKRGIDFILIPTTLLAQADASIGGKLGIDFNHFKNQIGVFQEPALTLLYIGFLKSLPYNETRSGFAEVIKHALISDKNLWEQIISKRFSDQPWIELLTKSAEFKYSIIKQDPHEKNIRKILNAGHTIGHALESFFLTKGNKIMHGEAVAAGLICESFIAVKRNIMDENSLQQIVNYILQTFGKLSVQENQLQAIALLCLQDKKNKGNKVLCVLPNGIGDAKWDVEISTKEIGESLSFYCSLQM